MSGILDEIVAYKRSFVEECRRKTPLREIERRALDAEPVRGFERALREQSARGCALIAEIKTASPSKGVIRDGVDPAEIARIYERNGASCVSVLTDERYFRGSVERFWAVRAAAGLPILRKDFIIDSYQLYEARAYGADAALLIAACLDDSLLADLIEIAAQLGLDVLLEVHDETEMLRAEKTGVKLIGINNRDLATFVTDLSVTERLAALAPERALLVSESGITSSDDVRRVHRMGARAVLVGEAIMREVDMGAKVRELAGAV
jgi:indole-3-glycerol phosphate synthase